MELKALLKVIGKYKKQILVLSLFLSALIALVSSYIPVSFRASATIYVKRQVEKGTPDYFTYEGFYSQQTAEKYTNTVVGFLNSNDIRRQALERLNLPSTQRTLEQLNQNIIVKKPAPQLISLQVVGESEGSAENLWEALAQTTIERVSLLNQTGDQQISIDIVNPKPLVEVISKDPILNGLVAFMVGVLLSVSFISLREYLEG